MDVPVIVNPQQSVLGAHGFDPYYIVREDQPGGEDVDSRGQKVNPEDNF